MHDIHKQWKADWLTALLLGLGLWTGLGLNSPWAFLSALLCALLLARLNASTGAYTPAWPKLGLYLSMGLAAAIMSGLLAMMLLGIDSHVQTLTAGACLAALLPTGLPVYAALTARHARQRMGLGGAKLTKPQALHALGHAQALVMDAPGLLIANQPEVHAMAAPFDTVSPKGRKGDPAFLMLALALVFCRQDPPDPLEHALENLARQLGYEETQLLRQYPRTAQRQAPWILSAHRDKRSLRVFVRGTMEQILPECTLLFDGGARVMQKADHRRILESYHALARYASHILVFATGALGAEEDPLSTHAPLAYVGMIGLLYPAMEDARELLSAFRSMHLVPVVATAAGAKDTLALVSLLERGHTHVNLDKEQKADVVRGWQAQGNLVLAVGAAQEDLPMMEAADAAVWLGSAHAHGAKRAALLLPLQRFPRLPSLLALAYDAMRSRRRFARWIVPYHALGAAVVIALAAQGLLQRWMIPLLPAIHMAMGALAAWLRNRAWDRACGPLS